MMPPKHDRRRWDRLATGCAVVCVLCTMVAVGVIAPTVLDTHHLTSENKKRIGDVARLSRENAALTRRIVREGRRRRDQTCTYAERQQRTETLRLRRTYQYLRQLTPAERNDRLNQFVLRGLPAQEKDARDSAAPPYCNGDGVGLDEPDPAFPERPPGLTPRP